MATLDLRGAKLDIQQEPGDSTAITLTMVDGDGDPFDLAGWEFTAPIDGHTGFTVVKGANTVLLTLPADTLTRSASWSLIGTSGGQTTTWLSGVISLGGRRSQPGTDDVTVTVDVGVTVTVSTVLGWAELEARLAVIEAVWPYVATWLAPEEN